MRAITGVAATGVVCLLAVLVAVGGPVQAQDAKPAPQADVATGATPTPGWTGTVTAEADANASVMTQEQTAIVQKVSGYFEDLENLKGVFLQTDPDQKQVRGRFYVKRPGRFRFEYGAPSKKVIISDGRWLAIQDSDLNTEDVYELDSTPFRLLLREDVNLLRDSRILDVQEAEDLIVLTMQDKDPDAPGRITLYLVKQPALQIKEWVTIDAQGLETRVEVSNLDISENIDPSVFKRENLTLKKFQQ